MTDSRPIPRGLLLLSVFTGGMTTLAIELAAARLLGSVFGTSNLVWANVIGLVLLYLTAGYFVGGRWADRSPYPRTFYRILVWGAFLSALMPLIARPALAAAASAVSGIDAGVALGSFAVVLVLFAAPITLLGMVSPFAIRLANAPPDQVGATAGRLYAVSTIGSLVGTFLPVLLTIPAIGTFATFFLFAGLLFIVGFIGLWHAEGARALRFVWMPIAIAVLAVIASASPLRAAAAGARIVFEDESAYNYIQVQEDAAGFRYLYLNEGQGIHSQYHPTQIRYGRTWDFFLAAPYFNAAPFAPADVESLLVVGLAAGTIPRQYAHVYGDLPMDGIEIDGAIVEAGARYFEMNAQSMPSLNVLVEDGRYALRGLDRRYSVIAVDAYRPPYIPWHLTTVEFFQETAARLLDNGVVAINVGRTSSDRRLVDALAATLLRVFPTVHAMDVPQSFNTILIASRQPTTPDNLVRNLAALPAEAPPVLREALTQAATSIVAVQPSDLVFTDDRAPVELLVDSLVLNFFLSGGIEELR